MARHNGFGSIVLGGLGVSALAALAAAGTMRASAGEKSIYPPVVEDQCRDDYFKYCSPYDLGTEELRRCMEAKGRALSSGCQQALKDAGYVKPERLRKGG